MVRHKNRYLVVQIQHDEAILTDRSIFTALQQILQQMFGDLGLGVAGGTLQVKCYEILTGLCIVRVSRDHVTKVWAAISMISKIGTNIVACRVLTVAGSARTCRIEAMSFIKRGLSVTVSSEDDVASVEAKFSIALSAFES